VPGYSDYTPRSSVSSAVILLAGRLEAACADGTFASKNRPANVGLPMSGIKAFVLRTEFARLPDAVRVKATLTRVSVLQAGPQHSHPAGKHAGIRAHLLGAETGDASRALDAGAETPAGLAQAETRPAVTRQGLLALTLRIR
jgi:hypothetical protein